MHMSGNLIAFLAKLYDALSLSFWVMNMNFASM